MKYPFNVSKPHNETKQNDHNNITPPVVPVVTSHKKPTAKLDTVQAAFLVQSAD